MNQIELLYERRHKMALLSSTARKAHYILDCCIDSPSILVIQIPLIIEALLGVLGIRDNWLNNYRDKG